MAILLALKPFVAFIVALIALLTNGGTEERVIDLPQDQGKWYLSVVGDSESFEYQELMEWFSEDVRLRSLRDQVHFCPVTTDSDMFKNRYQQNISGTPTIRLQAPDGVVIYEVWGANIPTSPTALCNDMVTTVQGCPLFRRCRPEPEPEPTPVLPDPEPQPLDDGGAPYVPYVPPVEPEPTGLPTYAVILLCTASLLAGTGMGVVKQWQATYSQSS